MFLDIFRQNVQKNLVTKFINNDLWNKNLASVINQRFDKIRTVRNIAAGRVIGKAMREVKDKICVEDNA